MWRFMKNFIFKVICFFLVLGLSLCKSNKPEIVGQAILVVIAKSGQVHFFRAGKEIPIANGSILVEGDSIATEASSFVDLEFPDGALVRVKEKSEVSIASLFSGEGINAEFNLKRGKIHTKIKNKLKPKESYRIKTSTMVAGVRGTDFSVTESDTGVIMVLEGMVAFESPNSSGTSVGAGKKGIGGTLEILDLSDEERKELEADSSSLTGRLDELKERIQENLIELKANQDSMLQNQKNSNQNTLDEQKKSNQNTLDEQKIRDQNSLNTQKEEDTSKLNTLKSEGAKNLKNQVETGKSGAGEIKSKSKESSSKIMQDADSQKKEMENVKKSMDSIKNTNPMDSVKPR